MTPDEMARIHRAAMTFPPPWDSTTLVDLLESAITFCVHDGPAFALGRVVADEAELLTLAVDPTCHRSGFGRRCLSLFEEAALSRGADRAFLEVAGTNAAARALYAGSGWREAGLRRGYYRHPDGIRIDAIVMSKTLKSA